MAAETNAAADVLADLEGQVVGKVSDEVGNVQGGAGVRVEHVGAVTGVSLLPADICEIVQHPGAMVAVIDAYADQAFLPGLAFGVPGVEEGAGDQAHAVLSVATAMEEPAARHLAGLIGQFFQAVYSDQQAGNVQTSP